MYLQRIYQPINPLYYSRFESPTLRCITVAGSMISTTFYMALALYAPALALSSTTPLTLEMSIIGMAAIATLYTTFVSLPNSQGILPSQFHSDLNRREFYNRNSTLHLIQFPSKRLFWGRDKTRRLFLIHEPWRTCSVRFLKDTFPRSSLRWPMSKPVATN